MQYTDVTIVSSEGLRRKGSAIFLAEVFLRWSSFAPPVGKELHQIRCTIH